MVKYLKYSLITAINLIFTLIAVLLSPILPIFVNKDGNLPNFLNWFQTFDATVDEGWKGKYFTNNENPNYFQKYYYRFLWLLRNPAYGFCYYVLGISFISNEWTVTTNKDITINNIRETLFIAHDDKGHFCFQYGGSLGELELGWKALHMYNTQTNEWSTTSWGPEMRIPTSFTPKIIKFWKIKSLFANTK